MNCKRILIVNTVQLNENSGTGHTLHNIFKLLPDEKLMQLVVHPDASQPVLSDVQTVFTPVSVCKVPYAVMRKRSAGKPSAPSAGGSVNIPKKGLSAAVHEMISAALDAFPVNIKPVLTAIDAFQPHVIYTCAATMRIMQIVKALSDHYDIPVVVHLMDDWPQTIYSSSVLSAVFRKRTLSLLRQLYKRSEVSFAVSGGLCKKYEHFSGGVTHLPLMNPAVIGLSPQIRKTAKLRFLYAGALSLRRDESLLLIAKTLHALRRQGGDSEFHIYAPPSQNIPQMQERFAQYGVQLHDYVGADQVYALYRSFDVLVFTESFDPAFTKFTSYSLSTKIPEYLAAGVPMLAFLPKQLYSAEYLTANKAACVCTDETALTEGCRALLENAALREQLAQTGFALAKDVFSEESVQKKLLSVFGSAE